MRVKYSIVLNKTSYHELTDLPTIFYTMHEMRLEHSTVDKVQNAL